MRKGMSAAGILMIALLLLCIGSGVISGETAYAVERANWDAPVGTLRSTGATKPERGTLLDEDNLGKVYVVQDEVGGWFRMVAPESGDYVFWVLAPDLKYGKFNIGISVDSKDAAWMHFEQSDAVQKGVLKNIEKGQVITWWNEDGTGRGYTLQSPFKMMITAGTDQAEVLEEVSKEQTAGISKKEIQAQLGIFNYDELTNVRKVETSKDGDYQSFDVHFESDVYYGGSDGYVDEWLTSDGIVAEIEIDMDGDGQDEYVVLYVKAVWEYGYRYDEFRIAICEAENGKYVKTADFECGFSMYGFGSTRCIELVSCDDGVRIISNSTDVFSYDGQKAYVELIAGLTTNEFNDEYDYVYGYSYALKGKFAAEMFKDLSYACGESMYNRSRLERLVSLNENNFFSTKSGDIEKGIRFIEECGLSAEIIDDYVRIKDGMLFAESSERRANGGWYNQMCFYTSLDHRSGTAVSSPDRDVAADTHGSATGTVYIHGSSNLRSGPGLGYGTVSSVAEGKTLTWLGEVSVDDRGVMWYKVLRNNGEAAWISSRYSELRTSDGSEPQIPFGKLMKGNKGERVIELQTMLKELGYHTGSIDGDFGGGTEKSVKAFQEAFKEKAGLSVTGEVDEKTWNAIKEALEPEKEEENNKEETVEQPQNTLEFKYIGTGGDNGVLKSTYPLVVWWEEIENVHHYEFAARYTDEQEQIIPQQDVGLKTQIEKDDENLLQRGRTLILWVGAYMNANDIHPTYFARQEVPVICAHLGERLNPKELEKSDISYTMDAGNHLTHNYEEVMYSGYTCSICGERVLVWHGSKSGPRLHRFVDGVCDCGYTVSTTYGRAHNERVARCKVVNKRVAELPEEIESVLKNSYVRQVIETVQADEDKFWGLKGVAKDVLGAGYMLFAHPVKTLFGNSDMEDYTNNILYFSVVRALSNCVVGSEEQSQDYWWILDETGKLLKKKEEGSSIQETAKSIVELAYCSQIIKSSAQLEGAKEAYNKVAQIGGNLMSSAKKNTITGVAIEGLCEYMQYKQVSKEQAYLFAITMMQKEQSITILNDVIEQLEETESYRLMAVCQDLRSNMMCMTTEDIIEQVEEQLKNKSIDNLILNGLDIAGSNALWCGTMQAAIHAGSYGVAALTAAIQLEVAVGEALNTSGKIESQAEIMLYDAMLSDALNQCERSKELQYRNTDNTVFFTLFAAEIELEGLKEAKEIYNDGLADIFSGGAIDSQANAEAKKLNGLIELLTEHRNEYKGYDDILPYIRWE